MPASKPISQRLPVVAIVGRPNVGKSSLFNKIVKRRIAIVHEESGVTRDRISSIGEFHGKSFLLVDTGGLGVYPGEKARNAMDEMVINQLNIAVESADKIIFVVDVQAGATALDKEISQLLRVSQKPVRLVANKADNKALVDTAYGISELGFDDITPISCTHNWNIDDLLEDVTSDFRTDEETSDTSDVYINLAVVGRPNVGKSSLVNFLLDEDRLIVSDTPGTTRDAVDSPISIDMNGVPLLLNLIDTAGIKRKRNLKTAVEYFSLARSKSAMKRADVVMIVLDAEHPGTAVDKKICREVADLGKPVIIVANKWDLGCKQMKQRELIEEIRYLLPFLDFAPIVTCCALSGYNVKQVLESVRDLTELMEITVPTPLLNRVVPDIIARQPPPSRGARSLRVYYSVFIAQAPPTVLLFVNDPKLCSNSYLAYLQNQFRTALGFTGLPVRVELRERQREQNDGRKRTAKKTRPKGKKTQNKVRKEGRSRAK